MALFIVALGTIQLASTFHTYALNLAELNGLKKQEAALVAQKRELENDIARWDDKAYVTARPGSFGIRLPRRTGDSCRASRSGDRQERAEKGTTYDESPKTALPWYKELAYSFKQADRSDPVKADSTKQSQHAGEEDKQDSQQQTGQSQQDGQQPSEDGQE